MPNVTISHAKSNIVLDYAGVVTVGNSSGGTVTMQATDLVRPSDWNSNHVASIQLTGADIASLFVFGPSFNTSSGASGITVRMGEEEIFEPFYFPLTGSTSHTPGIGTWYFDNCHIGNDYESGAIMIPVTCGSALLNNVALSQGAATQSGVASITQAMYHNFAVYQQGNGAGASTLSTIWTGQASTGITQVKSVGVATLATSNVQVSNYATLNIPGQWDLSGNVVYSTITASGTLSVAASSMVSSSIDSLLANAQTYLSGSRMDIIPFASTIGAGNVVIAHQFWSSSGSSSTGGVNYVGGTLMSTQVRPMLLEANLGGYRQAGKSSSNSTSMPVPWHGIHATSQSTAWSTVATSDLRATNVRLYWNFREGAIS